MLEIKTLNDFLGAEGKHSKKCSCRKLLKRTKRSLRKIRRILMNEDDFACRRESENALVWLVENFSRLEETAKSDMLTLKHLPGVLGDREAPLFYMAFSNILRKNTRLETEDIRGIVRVCNGYADGISLEDTASLLPIFRLCVCMKICECFIGLLNETNEGGSEIIENLFLTLDELLFFDENEVFESSRVEKILCSDPLGVYSWLSSDTKAVYRKNLIKLYKKKKITEKKLAEGIVAKCKDNEGNDRHIGKHLTDRACSGKTYVFLVFFMTLVFTILLCLISPVFLVSVFSVYGCSRLLADKFFVRFFVKSSHLPRVELSEIPEGFGVMTVITSLLTGMETDGELCERLENMYHSNGGKNIYFGLLLDLCDSDEKYSTKDAEIINRVKEKILLLRKKYGGCFFLFVREREYNEREEKFIAPERKRGAVNSLTKFLCSKGDDFCFGSIKPDEKICSNIKYVFTLDADTNLAFDSLKTMAGIMLHPQNRPVIDKEKNAVTKGYGILQPAMNPTLESARCSFFSAVMCGHGGVDFYSFGGSDTLMSMFGRSIFCGKGMFDKDCFYELLCKGTAFAENTVLSHDAPEGARLRCAFVPYVTLTDSFPSEELSYYKRQHRWIRGDIQNIPFLFSRVSTAKEQKIKNGIGYASKFFIWQNVYSALLPIFTLVTLFLSVLCSEGVSSLLVSAALSVYILPFGYSVFMGAKRALWHNFRRIFYSDKIYTGIWTSFFRMLFRLCAIPKSAAVSLDAAVRSTYRTLVSHKKMLEWTTAAQNDAEKRDGLLGYIKKNLVNALCGTLLFVLSPSGILKLLSLMWLFMPVFSYHSGKRKTSRKRHISEKDKNTLMGYCSDMWKFFSENVSEKTNNLPTDNVSLYPKRKISHMTSPTNIGLYLLSCLCSYKLGIADEKEMCGRILSCLESVDTLEKYNGLMYNWYDISLKSPMNPRYISSVDIGNFIACLVCVKQGIPELVREGDKREKICSMCQKLINQTDLSVLFDHAHKLFYIGATESDGKLIFDRNRYDMLMSEARILSFCAVAMRSVPSEHMKHLTRRFVKGKGYMGLASWSGTAFEFFMPEIFMPSREGSLVYEALCFAYTNMRNKGAGHGERYVFGISESCYNEFDSQSNYKYHAFGIPEIAVNVFEKQNVISPYSSFLCLKMSKKSVMKNLYRLQRLGAYGVYGFYESVDFERHTDNREYGVVKSFMSHHVGMSIASCTNLLCDDVVSQWFYKDEKMKSARELTEEKIPYDAYVKKRARQHYVKKIKEEVQKQKGKKTTEPGCCVTDGKKPITRLVSEIKENPQRVISTESFSCLVGEKSLGISFKNDIRCGMVSSFSGTDVKNMQGEVLFLDDGFDLCKNSTDTVFEDNSACFCGNYKGSAYSVWVYALPDEPCKIITVSGLDNMNINLEFIPSPQCDGERQIGAGLAFFGSKNMKESGFAFGFCKDGYEVKGADYSVDGKICVREYAENNSICVFCIGKAEKERAKEIYDRIRNNLCDVVKNCWSFSQSLRLREGFPDEKLKGVLQKYFVLPPDASCKRAFVAIEKEMFYFDCLLLMFSDFPAKKEYLIKAFYTKPDCVISKSLLCLILCEYVRVSGNLGVCDLKIRGETLYKRCLSYLCDSPETKADSDIFLLALERFSRLCHDCNDTRTSLFLMSRIQKIKGHEKDGIFL